MSMNAVRKRIEALEEAAAMKRGDSNGSGVMLSQADVALLWVERLMTIGDSLENLEKIARIDALLKSHRQACTRQKPEQMPPEIMEAAMRNVAGRDATPDYNRQRLDGLLETAT